MAEYAPDQSYFPDRKAPVEKDKYSSIIIGACIGINNKRLIKKTTPKTPT